LIDTGRPPLEDRIKGAAHQLRHDPLRILVQFFVIADVVGICDQLTINNFTVPD
jgi:hypothetical protein